MSSRLEYFLNGYKKELRFLAFVLCWLGSACYIGFAFLFAFAWIQTFDIFAPFLTMGEWFLLFSALIALLIKGCFWFAEQGIETAAEFARS
jgi:hypothetical protein